MKRFVTAALAVAASCPANAAATASGVVSLEQRLSALSVPFVPNACQWSDEVAFAAHLSTGVLFVTIGGRLFYRLPGVPEAASAEPFVPEAQGNGVRLLDQRPIPVGVGETADRVSFALGRDASRHRDALPAYERVSLGGISPGIGVQLRPTGRAGRRCGPT